MSRKSRNIVLLVLCFALAFSALACVNMDDNIVTRAGDALEGSPIDPN